MQARTLDFRDCQSVCEELDRLHKVGYDKAGTWDLAQACDHLTYFIDGSLDGHQFRVPWLMKVLFGRIVLGRILKQRRMKAGITTPQKPLPQPGGDEAAAVARLKHALQRLAAHQGELHPSPFFGYLTPQQWLDLHLIHCAHHLVFFNPKETAA
jgi:hypothetical protein